MEGRVRDINMRWRARHWAILISIVVIIILGLVFLITRILMNPKGSWWGVGITAMVLAFVGIVALAIWGIFKLKKQEPSKTRMDRKTAIEKAVHEILYDDHSPDNFLIEESVLMNVGEAGKPRTKILVLKGKGTESDIKIACVINLENPKLEMSRLNGWTDDTLEKTILRMAEFPESEVTDVTTTSYDPVTRSPVTTQVRTAMHRAEAEEKQKEEEANKGNSY